MDIVRKVVAGLVAITACLVYIHASHAAAPLQAGQAPGYYRMVLGDFEIVALSDGTVALHVSRPRQPCLCHAAVKRCRRSFA